MDFQTQVEALTGLSIGTGVTTTQLTQFLKDGVIDVTNRTITLKPEEMTKFSRRSGENTSQGYDPYGAKIISVIREAGTDNDWRSCREIPVDLQSRVTDSSSIHYASKFNPAFTIEDDGKIYVYPAPGSNPDTYKVYFVNTSPIDGSGNSLEHSDSTLGSFPADKVYLVVMYASIKSLDHLIEASHSMPEDLSGLVGFPEPSIPDSLNLSQASVSFSTSAPTYNAPVLSLEDAPVINDLTITTVPPTLPSLSSGTISFSTSAPTYNPALVTPDFTDANTWINTEEDSEMSAARVQVISAQLQEYQSNIQQSLNSFNKENAEYQIEFQKAVQNAQLSSTDDDQKIQRYQADLNRYQNDINKEVQEYTNNFNKELQLWQINRSTSIQKYQADIQNELNRFNKENTAYQVEFQKAVQNAQLENRHDELTVQDFQSKITKYSAQVNQRAQDISRRTVEVQQYSAEMQKAKMDIEIYKQRSAKLQQQYDAAFALMAPPAKQQRRQ